MTDLPLETGAVISSIPGMTASSTSSVLLSTITNMVSHASSLVNNATVSSESTTAFTGSTSGRVISNKAPTVLQVELDQIRHRQYFR